MTDKETADLIYKKYYDRYDGDVQGTCMLIAQQIAEAINGEVVAGIIKSKGRERTHWWSEKAGVVYDPMTDDKFYPDEYIRKELHRSEEVLSKILPHYEQYRVW